MGAPQISEVTAPNSIETQVFPKPTSEIDPFNFQVSSERCLFSETNVLFWNSSKFAEVLQSFGDAHPVSPIINLLCSRRTLFKLRKQRWDITANEMPDSGSHPFFHLGRISVLGSSFG